MIVEDFVVLGRTVPEESKKYGHRVCMAGYSPELRKLLRVYPLPVQNPLKQRQIHTFALERNHNDSRWESWKLSSRIPLRESTKAATTTTVQDFLQPLEADSIDQLNSDRQSLGVLRVSDLRGVFQERKGVKDELQLELFKSTDVAFGANAISVAPYLVFDDAGKGRSLQLREWGCYEYLRRFPGNRPGLWRNLQLHKDRDYLLLVGNMCNRRNIWLVINVFPIARKSQTTPMFEAMEA